MAEPKFRLIQGQSKRDIHHKCGENIINNIQMLEGGHAVPILKHN
jgi:hypothetical protein